MTGLADVARFRAEDPDALVLASFACPFCLRLHGVRWHPVLEDYDARVSCVCDDCCARWRVYLAPAQALRLSLVPVP